MSNIIKLDRHDVPNSIDLLTGNLVIVEQDKRSIMLTKIDLDKVVLKTMLQSGETSIKGEEKLKRLKDAGYIRLDARVCQFLRHNQHYIPESWKTEGYIFFDGTVFFEPHQTNALCIICMYWSDEGEWQWTYGWLDRDFDSKDPSACLQNEFCCNEKN